MRLGWVMLSVLLVVLVGCAQQSDEVVIGATLPLTGPAGAFGEVLVDGLEWKIEELQAQGHNVRLVIEDSQSDPKGAVAAFNKLTQLDDVDVVFTTLSSVSMALKPLAEEHQVLLWSFAAHPDITRDTDYVVRHSNTVDSDALVIGEQVLSDNADNIVIVYQQDDWGVSLDEELRKVFDGKSIVSLAIDHQLSDFKTELLRGMESEPDAFVFIAVGPAAGLLIKQVRELGYEGQIYSSVGVVLTPGITDIAGDVIEGTYYQTYEENDAFSEAYRKRYGKEPSVFGQVSYTSLEVYWNAVLATNTTEAVAVRDYVASLGEFEGTFETVDVTPEADVILRNKMMVWE